MPENDYNDHLNWYFYKAAYFRGSLIDEFCHLEHTIEKYLVRYFFDESEKRRELKNLILDRLTFEAKRTALKAMLDEKEKEKGFIKTKSNKYAHTELISEIRLLNDQRNYFAHYYLAIPAKFPSNLVICLAEYRDYVKTHDYTIEKYESILDRIEQAIRKLDTLMDDHFKHSGGASPYYVRRR
jgi:hypothetical protein